VQSIADRGAIAGLCPITEANLGDGIFGTATFLKSGGQFGIGTDSNVLIHAVGELRQLEYAQRLIRRERNVLSSTLCPSTGRTLYRAALLGGSQALGIHSVGFAVGHPADIVSLDNKLPCLCGRVGDSLLDSWIFTCRESAIDSVWQAGKKCVVNGRHIHSERVAHSLGTLFARSKINFRGSIRQERIMQGQRRL
jgi:cytosine/adenosine deaminase-related metal-dependent hydrolase